MEVQDLKLEAISFSAAPTKSQLVNMLRDITTFLGRVGGALILDGSYTIAEPPMGAMFNGSIQLKAAADGFEAGPNASGLAVPQGGPRVVGQR
jgi:hypothetical protein